MFISGSLITPRPRLKGICEKYNYSTNTPRHCYYSAITPHALAWACVFFGELSSHRNVFSGHVPPPPKKDRASTGQRHGAPFADVCTRRVGSQAPFKTARGLPSCGPPPRTPSAFLGRTRRQLAETGVTCTQRARAECKPSCRSQADLQSCPSSPRSATSGATKISISLLG